MSLFATTLTPAQQAANQVMANGNQLFSSLIASYQRSYNLVWDNPHPDLVVAAMGTNAVKVFTASAGLAAYLNSLGAGVVATMPAGWNFQANTDGSVVLTKTS